MENVAGFQSNVVIVDADYLGCVAFDLTVNFERMLERRVEPADLARWLDCLALDGGIRPGENTIQCVFIHPKEQPSLRCFAPSDYAVALNGKAFRDNLGEFLLQSIPVEPMVSREMLVGECFEAVCATKEVERILVVADMEAYGTRIKDIASQARDKDITLFAMQPLTGRGFSQEILGYSLLQALGISASELG